MRAQSPTCHARHRAQALNEQEAKPSGNETDNDGMKEGNTAAGLSVALNYASEKGDTICMQKQSWSR